MVLNTRTNNKNNNSLNSEPTNNNNTIDNIPIQDFNINPWFLTGYTDGDGTFSIRFRTSISSAFGYNISLVYAIGAHQNPNNRKLLEDIKRYFNNEGSISKCGNQYQYEISSLKGLRFVRKHFENYSLQTTKDFKLWCKVLEMIENEEHLTEEGFDKISKIKDQFPKSKFKKEKFQLDLKDKKNSKTDWEELELLCAQSYLNLNPYWISGFVQADGTFGLNYMKSKRMTLGYTCQPQFRITQHKRDLKVLIRIINTIGCGSFVKPSADRSEWTISVSNVLDISSKVIPFFDSYPLQGSKYLDYLDFKKGINIMKEKGHLNNKGLAELKEIAYQMNTYRKFE